jgi:CBS domain-containing protein
MQVRDIMNINAIRILSTSTMAEAAELAAMSNASGLFVVDDEDNFIGVLSEGDMMKATLPEMSQVMAVGRNLRESYDIFSEKGARLGTESIDNHLISDPITLNPGDPLLKAATTMAVKKMRRLPVVKNGKLVGTVSRGDICKAVLK